MALPDGFDFLVRDEFAAPGLLKPFADGSPCFLIERHDWGLLGHRQHGNRNGILVFRRKLARPFDRLFKQLRHGHHRIIFASCREAAKATGAPGRTRTSTTLRPPDFESGASTDSATGAYGPHHSGRRAAVNGSRGFMWQIRVMA